MPVRQVGGKVANPRSLSFFRQTHQTEGTPMPITSYVTNTANRLFYFFNIVMYTET